MHRMQQAGSEHTCFKIYMATQSYIQFFNTRTARSSRGTEQAMQQAQCASWGARRRPCSLAPPTSLAASARSFAPIPEPRKQQDISTHSETSATFPPSRRLLKQWHRRRVSLGSISKRENKLHVDTADKTRQSWEKKRRRQHRGVEERPIEALLLHFGALPLQHRWPLPEPLRNRHILLLLPGEASARHGQQRLHRTQHADAQVVQRCERSGTEGGE